MKLNDRSSEYGRKLSADHMISVEEALNIIVDRTVVLAAETKELLDCREQVLAEDIRSDIDIPIMDNSAMDGYAVRAEDTGGAAKESPRVLKIIDTVIAGDIAKKTVVTGTAIRIMTGAPVPAGANSVVKFEDTDEKDRAEDAGEIGILLQAKPGLNVRKAGADIAAGSLVLRKGTVLKPAHIGMLASIGRHKATVIRRPKIAVLATGNELVELEKPLPPGKIYNSNSYGIAAMVAQCGGTPAILGITRDNENAIADIIRHGIDADMLITTGGVSVGDYDVVKDVLMKQGEIRFWRVRMKPGKPVAFGSISGKCNHIPHLALPGNPVSAMVTFELFARPAILKMMGRTKLTRTVLKATMESNIVNDDGRRIYARAVVEYREGRYYARLTGPQDSNILTSMGLANALIIVPEDQFSVKTGDKVSVIMIK